MVIYLNDGYHLAEIIFLFNSGRAEQNSHCHRSIGTDTNWRTSSRRYFPIVFLKKKRVMLNEHVLPLLNWSRVKMAYISDPMSSKAFLNANTRVLILIKLSPRDLSHKGASLIWLLACNRLGNKPLLNQWWHNSLSYILRHSASASQWVKVSSILHDCIIVTLCRNLVEWSLSFCGYPFLFQFW